MPAAKKQLFIIVDVNYDDVREVEGTHKEVEAELQSISDDREYGADELRSSCNVYEVTARIMFDAETSLRVYVAGAKKP